MCQSKNNIILQYTVAEFGTFNFHKIKVHLMATTTRNVTSTDGKASTEHNQIEKKKKLHNFGN